MSCKLGMAVSFLHNIAPNFGSSVLHRFISNHQIIFCMNLNKVGKRKKMQVLNWISLITIFVLKINSTFHFSHMRVSILTTKTITKPFILKQVGVG
jgi:hypothetical protein